MARTTKSALIPEKTPLAPASADIVKRLQLIIRDARKEANAKRPNTQQESPQIVELIDSIGFIDARLEDGTPVALRFVAGLEKHPGTGLDYYAVIDRESAAAIKASAFAHYKWRAEKDKQNGSVTIRAQQTAETTTAARIIYRLAHPGEVKGRRFQVSIQEDDEGKRNALDLRLSKLGVRLSPYVGQSVSADLSAFHSAIDGVLAEHGERRARGAHALSAQGEEVE